MEVTAVAVRKGRKETAVERARKKRPVRWCLPHRPPADGSLTTRAKSASHTIPYATFEPVATPPGAVSVPFHRRRRNSPWRWRRYAASKIAPRLPKESRKWKLARGRRLLKCSTTFDRLLVYGSASGEIPNHAPAASRKELPRNAAWWAENHSSKQAARWLDTIESQLESLADFPESHSLSAENDAFQYEIRDKLLGLGSRPSYRAVFTIKGDTVFVLTIRRGAQDVLRPSDVESQPSS